MTKRRPSPAKTPARGKPPRAGTRKPAAQPAFRELTTTAALRVLRRNSVGRIAFALHGRVDVQPVHYVVDERWLYLRTSVGKKVGAVLLNPSIAFEVDEVESMFSWRSVVAHGKVDLLSPDGTPDVESRYVRAVQRLRDLLPETLAGEDPVPFRALVLGIYIEELTGREAVQPGLRLRR